MTRKTERIIHGGVSKSMIFFTDNKKFKKCCGRVDNIMGKGFCNKVELQVFSFENVLKAVGAAYRGFFRGLESASERAQGELDDRLYRAKINTLFTMFDEMCGIMVSDKDKYYSQIKATEKFALAGAWDSMEFEDVFNWLKFYFQNLGCGIQPEAVDIICSDPNIVRYFKDIWEA